MTKIENLLTTLIEECNETAQRASKAIRFTVSEIQTGQKLTNAQRIVYEFNDIVALMELLEEEGVLHVVIDREAIEQKKKKVLSYIEYSKKIGTINED